LELGVQSRDFDIEFDVIFVEFGLLEFEKGVTFGSEIVHFGFELENKIVNTLEIMLLQSVKLLLSLEDFD
jgi:hypothetical protein